ncbi:MAG: 50S ribosomal protein L15 [Deltaproteobacteria bacterium]|nr:50S ribosomal protein L15 [Deltaproteobacteria bacterium]
MKELSNLTPPEGATKTRRRVGRGVGSGLGKTSGKGHKGQRARAGKGKVRPFFEGGQMPLYRRLPKRGFNNVFAEDFVWINVSQLNRFDDDAVVDLDSLRAIGLVKGRPDGVKCLGKGTLEKRLTVKLDAFSKSAVAKIEEKGGKAEVTRG